MFTPSDVEYTKAMIEMREYIVGFMNENPTSEFPQKEVKACLDEMTLAVDKIRESYRNYGFDDGFSEAKRIYENEYGKGFEDGRLEGYKEGYEIGTEVVADIKK